MKILFDFSEKIREFLEDLFTDILESMFSFIAEILFQPEKMTGFFKSLYDIFIGIGAMLIVCIALYSIIMSLIHTHRGGSSEERWIDIFVDIVKSSAMIIIMPFILWFVLGKIVYPIGEFMMAKVGTFGGEGLAKLLTAGPVGQIFGPFMFLIVFGFIAISITAFAIKMCIYHADILFLQLVSPLAAVSIMAEDNNYAGVWWREFLSQITTIVLQVAAMAGVVEILTNADPESGFTWYKFMLLIGLCVLLIRGPSVTRSMWYATGSGKAMMNQGGKLATRLFMINRITS